MTPDTTLAAQVQAAVPFRTDADLLTQVAERFSTDIAAHTLTVLHDDGLYRHLRFSRPGSSTYSFDIVTWPGVLTIHGDMGTYVFSRLQDMFDFFRGDRINPSYWAQKLQTKDRVTEFSPDAFREHVVDAVIGWAGELSGEGDDDEQVSIRVGHLLEALQREVLQFGEDEQDARFTLDSFTHDGCTFADTWEWDLHRPTFHFLWSCHALSWGIALYDAQHASTEEPDSAAVSAADAA